MIKLSLSELLKQNTKSNHQQLEKLLVTKLRLISTTEDYIKLLQLFYGYFGGLEDKIIGNLSEVHMDDHLERRKTLSIANDIKILGGTLNEKAKEGDLPQIENFLQALGALYVIEGSTLGGRVIVKMLQRQLDIEHNKGLSFFSGYGEETESMWTSFKELLNNQTLTLGETELIIAAADSTFEKFKLWIEKNDL